MNRTETTELITYLNRAGLVGAMEGQAAVWADALDDVRLDDVEEVARRITKTHTGRDRWVTPGDIRAEIRLLRKERTATAVPPAPPAAIANDVARTLEWQRTWIRRIGDGATDSEATRLACAEHSLEPDYGELVQRNIAALVRASIPGRAS